MAKVIREDNNKVTFEGVVVGTWSTTKAGVKVNDITDKTKVIEYINSEFDKGTTISKVAKELGLGYKTFQGWKDVKYETKKRDKDTITKKVEAKTLVETVEAFRAEYKNSSDEFDKVLDAITALEVTVKENENRAERLKLIRQVKGFDTKELEDNGLMIA